ncbi:hypothetical protein Stsp02_68240 [Streptomyces sp. NBRC 14336]|uniref:hypothetical protein n=1 Tax=Streptomyces sp. NBRC 14336 TaxID=3030992 RepID=UPI0024A3A957|nr:hypothetical protein [Streptomyces sp. NBRC 14336]GLW51163.1 hypothetical protein Stsp02_68240 [Streptomyces sp. NBRC 14336]
MSDARAWTAEEAAAALRAAEEARLAAVPRTPAWFGPARGVLFAVAAALYFGFTGTAALSAALLATVLFLAVHVVAVRSGGVVAWPASRPLKVRLLSETVPITAYAIGWLAALPAGRTAGAVTSAVLGGAALWAVSVWRNATAGDRRSA